MADKLLHLPLPHLPKLHRPKLHIKKHRRREAVSDTAGDATVAPGAEDAYDDNDQCMPAVQRVQAEASEASQLFNLPKSEVCWP